MKAAFVLLEGALLNFKKCLFSLFSHYGRCLMGRWDDGTRDVLTPNKVYDNVDEMFNDILNEE